MIDSQTLHGLIKRQRNHKPNIDNVIYAVFHYSCHDFTHASEIMGKRCWILVGKQKFDIISLLALLLNGIVWVDRKSKRKVVKWVGNLLFVG